MARTGPIPGILCKLYYNTGTFGSPTWTEVSVIEGLTLNTAWDKSDVVLRDRRVKSKVKTLMDLGATIRMIADKTDTVYLAFLAAQNADTVLDVLILKGAKDSNGTTGYRFETQVHKADEDQGSGVAAVYDEMELAPYPGPNLPSSVVVTSGAPVLTTLVF